MPDRLPADLAAALSVAAARVRPFDQVEYFAEVDSTNDIALSRAAAGAPHGAVILADAQRAGRGRQGRAWFSPPGAGLYLSAVLRPESWADTLPLVTLAAGVAVARGLRRASGLALELKWPNDVVIGRPWRKVAGILAESVSTGSRIDAIVLGMGINLRPSAFPPEIADRATALELETDRPVDASACVVEVLASLAETQGWLQRRDRAAVVTAWREHGRAGLGGAMVRWNDDRGEHRGRARDIDDHGALVVETGGDLARLVAGEVFWEQVGRE
jgi:BirA family biotin operon repressor/biotin-[acetyl-CoA-carboxylase] ligase